MPQFSANGNGPKTVALASGNSRADRPWLQYFAGGRRRTGFDRLIGPVEVFCPCSIVWMAADVRRGHPVVFGLLAGPAPRAAGGWRPFGCGLGRISRAGPAPSRAGGRAGTSPFAIVDLFTPATSAPCAPGLHPACEILPPGLKRCVYAVPELVASTYNAAACARRAMFSFVKMVAR